MHISVFTSILLSFEYSFDNSELYLWKYRGCGPYGGIFKIRKLDWQPQYLNCASMSGLRKMNRANGLIIGEWNSLKDHSYFKTCVSEDFFLYLQDPYRPQPSCRRERSSNDSFCEHLSVVNIKIAFLFRNLTWRTMAQDLLSY